ncbi:MAG: Sua5/YciO/YrdC/YwlC family protein, partial [Oscillospiraceae bacterium]|nr:Sua5/YciO/YrdC/YwlC family protein [Oscillospiraceae bacterium]
MNTKLLKIDDPAVQTAEVQEAAAILLKGGLVAIPTETVYGLGANALNPEAAKQIFVTKGRPQ